MPRYFWMADGSFVPDANGELSSNGIYYTNKSGEIRISGIVGTVIATETKTISGFTIDEATRTQTVVVNPNDTQTLTFYNKPTTTLIIQKYISGTKNEPLAGVQFLVTDSSGAVVGPNNGYYTTDAAGQIVIEGLTDGMTVTAKEVKSVDGFVLLFGISPVCQRFCLPLLRMLSDSIRLLAEFLALL